MNRGRTVAAANLRQAGRTTAAKAPFSAPKAVKYRGKPDRQTSFPPHWDKCRVPAKADNGNGFGGISRPFRQHKPADDKRHRRKVAKNVYRKIQPTENKRSQRRKQCRRQPRRSNGKTPVCGKQRRTGRQQGKRQPSVKQRKYLTAKQCRIKNKLAVAPLKQSGIPAQDLRCTFNPVPIVVADKECNLIIQNTRFNAANTSQNSFMPRNVLSGAAMFSPSAIHPPVIYIKRFIFRFILQCKKVPRRKNFQLKAAPAPDFSSFSR